MILSDTHIKNLGRILNGILGRTLLHHFNANMRGASAESNFENKPPLIRVTVATF